VLRTLAVVAGTLVVVWLVFVAFVVVAGRRRSGVAFVSPQGALRLLPDTVRLVRGLCRDDAIPRRTRWLVFVLLAYLVSPIDIIPDFVPVIGFADDVVITSLVLRHVIRRSGSAALERHWPGSPEGLAALRSLLRLGGAEAGPEAA